ncbi:hypothetical protein [Flavobacterium aestivum]|uniref:hypothetical protein n=1 Tax=Flavobacterium aestivum TaxID=3003257 RepID=UPI002482192E|nr:hypothetical protein [Flavobacterium aestivum]
MIDYKAKVISGKSLIGIEIGSNINNYLTELYSKNVSVAIKIYNENKKNELHNYIINGNVKINTLNDGSILNITCMNSLETKFNDDLYSGITVVELKKKTEKQSILHGSLFLNGDYGICYVLPSPYDEIGDTINHLPDSLVLNEVCIGDFSWWFKPELTPDYAKG